MKRLFLLLMVFLYSPCFAAAVAQWKCNDNTTNATVVDSVGSNTGTFSDANGDPNTDTHSTTGKVYEALTFDGTDDYIDIGVTFQSTFRDSFSISLWIKPDDGRPSGTEIFIGGLDATGDNSEITVGIETTGKLVCTYYSEGNFGNHARTSVIFSNGQEIWHHIVVVLDSTVGGIGGKLIYFDGVNQALDTDGSTSGVTFSEFTSAQNFYIGARNGGGTTDTEFAGLIDNVIIYDQALTLAEVKILYNNGKGTEEVGFGIPLRDRARSRIR